MKKKILLFTLLLFGLSNSAITQRFAIEYQQCHGGSASDGGREIIQIEDSTLIVFGSTSSSDGDISFNHGENDFWLIETDLYGNLIWEKTYGGSDADGYINLHKTNEGDYILFGKTQSIDGDVSGNHGGLDYWVVKVDDTGNIIWQRCIGSSVNDYASQMSVDEEGNIYVIGNTHGDDGDITDPHGFVDYWIAKLNSDGEIMWDRSLGGSSADWGTSICVTDDGGYIVGGATISSDGDVECENTSISNWDMWIVKLDSLNNIQWQRCYGGSHTENAVDIKTTEDGGYIIAGITNSNDGDVSGFHGVAGSDYGDFWILKIDSTGNIMWQNCFGGTKTESLPEITLATDGGYIINGHTNSHDGDVSGNNSTNLNSDIWLFKLSDAGDLLWQQCFGSELGEGYNGICIISETEIFIAGGASHTSGDVECSLYHPGPPWESDLWMFKIADTMTVDINEILPLSSHPIAYPNPAKAIINFEWPASGQESLLEIINLYGTVIVSKPTMDSKETIDIQTFNSGMYFYRIRQGIVVHTGRFVVL